jgi:hypothetical protein
MAQINDFRKVSGLQYVDYGQWNVNPSSTANQVLYAGVFAGSSKTSLTVSMPTSGTAVFSGGAAGYVVQPGRAGGTAGSYFGTSTLTADFTAGTVTGAITGITAYSVQNDGAGATPLGSVNNINLNGTISGAIYTGTASAAAGAGTAFDITGATGTLKGGFYGPNAAETGGVFYLTGGTNNISLMGSFGGKPALVSDIRLKTDIEPAGTLANGLRLHRWRYIGGDRRFTGVMAQELLADSRFADAVRIDADGLMRVDYDALGYAPEDMPAMRAEGEAAVARFRCAPAMV